MIRIGEMNALTVVRDTSAGMFLGDPISGDVVLLPGKFIPDGLNLDDILEVFIYKDSEDRLVATTQTPLIKLDSFACLEVKAVNNIGAFMDWGLDKDLLVPFKEQKVKMNVGEKHVVFLYIDVKTERLAASSKLSKYYFSAMPNFHINEEVGVLIVADTKLGYEVVVNNGYRGLIYHNEIFQDIHIGDTLVGYVKKVRGNNEIDISLQKNGFENVLSLHDIILKKLEENKGFLPLSDVSTPEEILKKLHMSKKTFKKTIGMLYKQRLIRIAPEGIYIADKK